MVPSWLPLVASLAVLVGVGVHVGRRARRAATMQRAAAAWAQTAGTVLSTTIQMRRVGQSRSETPMVIYSLPGRWAARISRIACAPATRPAGIRVIGDASRTLERYPVGSNVTVYYDPADPANAALER